MSKKKKLTSDNVNITYDTDSWVPSDGLQMAGTVDSLDPDEGMTYTQGYSFGDLGELQLDLFPEEDMREKYPALKQAWEHYQSVLEVCKTKEKEDNED